MSFLSSLPSSSVSILALACISYSCVFVFLCVLFAVSVFYCVFSCFSSLFFSCLYNSFRSFLSPFWCRAWGAHACRYWRVLFWIISLNVYTSIYCIFSMSWARCIHRRFFSSVSFLYIKIVCCIIWMCLWVYVYGWESIREYESSVLAASVWNVSTLYFPFSLHMLNYELRLVRLLFEFKMKGELILFAYSFFFLQYASRLFCQVYLTGSGVLFLLVCLLSLALGFSNQYSTMLTIGYRIGWVIYS